MEQPLKEQPCMMHELLKIICGLNYSFPLNFPWLELVLKWIP